MANWPQALKDYAKRVFTLADDSNREAVNEELRKIIFDAHVTQTINTIDWANRPLPSSLGAAAAATNTPHIPLGGGTKSKRKIPAPPALTPEEQSRRDKRARRFEAPSPLTPPPGPAPAPGAAPKKTRFGQPPPSAGPPVAGPPRPFGARPTAYGVPPVGGPPPPLAAPETSLSLADPVEDPNVIDWDKDTVVGTSTALEKPYLRLTSAPDPRTVRPLAVLEQTLSLLKKKWRSEHNYAYICDQFKSLRQDLTVQRIKNPFTVQVYEIHARIALEKGDLGEYNQCQSQLLVLYELGIPGRISEFTAYRILYLLHTGNKRELNSLLPSLQLPIGGAAGAPKRKDEPAVKHALDVRQALLTGNYRAFFRLYIAAPNMNAYILDHLIDRERTRALLTLAYAHRPTLPLTYLRDALAYTETEDVIAFLKSLGADTWASQTPPGSATPNGSNALLQLKWDPRAALPLLLTAAQKFKRVDIKGQV